MGAKARHPARDVPRQLKLHGRKAGPIRNNEMADKADALIAIWDGQSRGTKHMIDAATKHGLRVHVHNLGETS